MNSVKVSKFLIKTLVGLIVIGIIFSIPKWLGILICFTVVICFAAYYLGEGILGLLKVRFD